MLNAKELSFINQIAKDDEQKQKLIDAKLKANEEYEKEQKRKEKKEDDRVKKFLKKLKGV